MEPQINREKKREKFLAAAKPFMDAKATIYQSCKQIITFDGAGKAIRVDLHLTPEQKESLRAADEAIDYIRTNIFSEEFEPWNRK